MKKIIILITIAFIGTGVLYADRGGIPFRPHVRLFEPNQRAIIAWDGQEEILLLTTDLRASEPTKVLEVLPLPSEPNVTKGDIEVFSKATDLINRKLAHHRKRATTRDTSRATHSMPAGEITFHEKIGAHDVSVAHVLNSKGFVKWVEEYLRSVNVENPRLPEGLKEVVSEYLEDGFTWFVFDVVELDDKIKTNDAIQYRFKTDFLYYPLKITKTGEGSTTVDLLILTPRLLSQFAGVPLKDIIVPHRPIYVNRKELQELDKDMYDLLSKFRTTRLRIWRIRGRLSEFDRDLIVGG